MYSQKKSKLVNPYFFVSQTRLSVHNLPVNVDEHRLKRVFLQAAAAAPENSDEARVTQVLKKILHAQICQKLYLKLHHIIYQKDG